MKAGALLARLQPLGRALMLPIAVLPVAALLLRLGQPDLLAIPFLAAAGTAIFDNLGLLFAAGIAVGLARENHGAAGLAGIVCYLVASEGAKPLLSPGADVLTAADPALRALQDAAWRGKEIAKLSVPAGILSGLIAGGLYNRYHAIRLPSYLGFFGGRRFVPIAAGATGVLLALVLGRGFPWFENGIDLLSRSLAYAGPAGLFLYGLLNRLLLVTGLHHILNNLVWFVAGDYNGATGDLKRFFAGDPTAGAFMAGYFPIMMFGLPAACLAMYRAAPPNRRARVAGLYLSLALTSFLTGVTEPIEFSFLFLAPVLFAIHAVLTGLAMVVMDLLGVRLGFGFSAGLLDYVLNFGLASRPLLLIPVGAAFAAIYYAIFSWAIRRFDLKTTGREAAAAAPAVMSDDARAPGYVAALGGRDNIATIDACTTRLRLQLRDTARVDRDALTRLGARGVLDLGEGRVQVVIGPEADQIAAAMRAGTPAAARPDARAAPAAPPVGPRSPVVDALRDMGARDSAALGRRLIVTLPAKTDPGALERLPGVRMVATIGACTHLLLNEPARALAQALTAPERSGAGPAPVEPLASR